MKSDQYADFDSLIDHESDLWTIYESILDKNYLDETDQYIAENLIDITEVEYCEHHKTIIDQLDHC